MLTIEGMRAAGEAKVCGRDGGTRTARDSTPRLFTRLAGWIRTRGFEAIERNDVLFYLFYTIN
jgi:hypothetical protein